MSCGVGCRCGLDLVLLWLWCRPAATAPIWPLGWEPPYSVGAALKKDKKKKKKKRSRDKKKNLFCNCMWWWMLPKCIPAIISRYKYISNHYVVHLKLIQCYMPIIYLIWKKEGKVFSWERNKMCAGIKTQRGEKIPDTAVREIERKLMLDMK